MTVSDLTLAGFKDTWVNSGQPGQNYGSAKWVQLQSGSRIGFLKPSLGNIAGRTVVDAYLVGRAGPGFVAQTLTATPVVDGWVPGRVTWSNRPAVSAAAAVSDANPATPDGGVVEIRGLASMIQAVADGTDWRGLQVTTSAATNQRLYSTDSGEPAWELHVTLSDAPEQPANLRPDGGAVSSGSPILAWDFLDLGGDSTEQAAVRIQVDSPAGGADPDGVTPDYDSGWQTNADPQWDLAGRHAAAGAGPHFWRVQVRDATPNESEWSDWAEFTVAAAPTLVIDSPTGPFGDPTPTLLAHLTGDTVKSWQAMATGPDRSDVRAESGMQTGAINWTVPERGNDGTGRRVLREDEQGWLYVRAWGQTPRAVAVGQQPYVEAWIQADWDEDAGVTPVSNLLVGQVAQNDPRLLWSWERTEAAEAYLLQVDGITVARVAAEDVAVDAGRYQVTDRGQVPPMRPNLRSVRAVEDGNVSAAVSVLSRHNVALLWFIHDELGPLGIADTELSRFTRVDRLASYTPVSGPEIDVIYDFEGRRAEVEGQIFTGWCGDVDVWAAVDLWRAVATSATRTGQLVWGSQSVRVRVRDVDVTSHDDIDPASNLHVVRFGFIEVGD